MKRILHIIATPREEASRTLQISHAFLEEFKKKHSGWTVDELNLAKEHLPPINVKSVTGKYVLLSGKELSGNVKELWAEVLQHIERFKKADLYLVSAPMWNFGITYMLKHYLDLIVQPTYLFNFTQKGPEGLIKNKKLIITSARGGDYTTAMKQFDFHEPYLRTIFGFIGLTDVEVIRAEPVDMGPDIEKQKVKEAQEKARKLGSSIHV